MRETVKETPYTNTIITYFCFQNSNIIRATDLSQQAIKQMRHS